MGVVLVFEHQGQQHKLVIVDNIGAHKPFFAGSPHVVGYDQQTHENRKEYIAEFHHLQTLTSGRWVTNDYDFTRSRADIMSLDSQPRQTSFNQQEIFDWPGNYGDPATGDHLARVRMEEQGAAGSRSQGAPRYRRLCVAVFSLWIIIRWRKRIANTLSWGQSWISGKSRSEPGKPISHCNAISMCSLSPKFTGIRDRSPDAELTDHRPPLSSARQEKKSGRMNMAGSKCVSCGIVMEKQRVRFLLAACQSALGGQ